MTDEERAKVREETLAEVRQWIETAAAGHDELANKNQALSDYGLNHDRTKAAALRRFAAVYL